MAQNVLGEVQKTMVTRLRELAPLIGEFEELRDAAEKLGIDWQQGGTGTAAAAASSPASQATSATTRRRSSSGGGRRKAASTRASGSSRASSTRKKSTRAKAPARRASATRSGGRRDQMLEVVRNRPGITVPEVAQQLGLSDYTGLYRVQRGLQEEGLVRKDGQKLFAVEQASADTTATAPEVTGGQNAA